MSNTALGRPSLLMRLFRMLAAPVFSVAAALAVPPVALRCRSVIALVSKYFTQRPDQ